MGFKSGIVGLPNVGKSTIFNALTQFGAQASNYPFCTIEPNVGRVDVPDQRLCLLEKYIPTQKVIPASMEFVDIAGLVKGAAQGEGLGNQFLGHIRQTDAIVHVVRCFEDDDITHVEGSVDPIRDIGVIDSELIFADNETVEKALTRYRKQAKSGDKMIPQIIAMLEALADHMQQLQPARVFPFEQHLGDEAALWKVFQELHLITAKKVLYACNVDESLADGTGDNPFTLAVKEHASKEGAEVIVVCGKLEQELSELEPDEKAEMLADLGIPEPGLNRLIRAGYHLLNLRTYFTAGEKEIRAWTFHDGDKAPQAAGKIHSDFERGFIRADVFSPDDLVAIGTKTKLRENGLIKQQGKEYLVQDGDVMEFFFNV